MRTTSRPVAHRWAAVGPAAPARPGRPAAPHRRPVPPAAPQRPGRGRCLAAADRSVFGAVEHRLAGGLDPGWAPRLRSALARYHRAEKEFAEQPGALARWRQVRDTLAVVERMSAQERVPSAALEAMREGGLWESFDAARALCRSELGGRRPRAGVPPPPAVHKLGERLRTMPRRGRPAAVNRWRARLQENLHVYIMSEAQHRREALPPPILAAAVGAVLGCLMPPAPQDIHAAGGSRRLRADWEVEVNRPAFQEDLRNCRNLLLLRAVELRHDTAENGGGQPAGHDPS